jgi:hypothetical protein
MKKIVFIIVALAVLSLGGAYVRSQTNPCNRVLSYDMGLYDARFNITPDQFLKVVQDMEHVWEDAAGKELFEYNPGAKFKINLVFDDRQQKTIDERDLKQKIDLSEESYESQVSSYNNLSFQQKEKMAFYERDKADFDRRLAEYNSEVSYWNDKGGAPQSDYQRLSREKESLNGENDALDVRRLEINAMTADLNALADHINTLAKRLNKDVDAYNGKFGQARQFDQGTYTDSGINIYQFNEYADLRLVMAHELGHALTLDHVDDPEAVMYYLMDQQDLTNIHLSQGDINALTNVCR